MEASLDCELSGSRGVRTRPQTLDDMHFSLYPHATGARLSSTFTMSVGFPSTPSLCAAS